MIETFPVILKSHVNHHLHMLAMAFSRSLKNGKAIRTKEEESRPTFNHHLMPDLHKLVINNRVFNPVTNDSVPDSLCFLLIFELSRVAA